MPLDPEVRDANRTATERIRRVAGLSDDELRHPLGEHWTVAIMLAHLAFWDRRALDAVARSESGSMPVPDVDMVVNDLSLALWAVLPPREAARLAIESAEALDARIETLPDAITAELLATNPHWIRRSIHRDLHLDEAEAALA